MRAGLRDELFELEQALLTPAVRGSPERLKELLAEDFLEFGASGVVHDRESVIALLVAEPDRPAASMSEFDVHPLSADAVLVTYRSRGASGDHLRSSVWRREAGVWRMKFHQGTPAGR